MGRDSCSESFSFCAQGRTKFQGIPIKEASFGISSVLLIVQSGEDIFEQKAFSSFCASL